MQKTFPYRNIPPNSTDMESVSSTEGISAECVVLILQEQLIALFPSCNATEKQVNVVAMVTRRDLLSRHATRRGKQMSVAAMATRRARYNMASARSVAGDLSRVTNVPSVFHIVVWDFEIFVKTLFLVILVCYRWNLLISLQKIMNCQSAKIR